MKPSQKQFISTMEAAKILGYTVQHTRLLIREGKLAASKFGRDWMIERDVVQQFAVDRDERAERG